MSIRGSKKVSQAGQKSVRGKAPARSTMGLTKRAAHAPRSAAGSSFPVVAKGASSEIAADEPRGEVLSLRRELTSTHNYLRSLLTDHEATYEELKAANEGVHAANEELQSTNEELETTKEELQSSNEELTTLNQELQNRNTELARVGQ
jgi:two-component system CheB/CheR fusion protein